MQLGSMFISNCNNTLRVSDAICVHPQVLGSLYMLTYDAQKIKHKINGNNGSNNNYRNRGCIGNKRNHDNVSGESSHNGMLFLSNCNQI